MTTQELVIEWSDRLLMLLEEYRAQNPNFKYWLRKINNEKRLSNGQWFQGNHKYIFIGFYNVGAGANRTRSIGFIVNFDEQNGFFITLDVITEGESDPTTLALYKKIVDSIPGFEKKTDTKYINYLGKENIEDTLLTFLDQQKPIIDSLIDEFGLKDRFTIPDDTFKKSLSAVMDFRYRLRTKALNKDFWKYSPGAGAVVWEDNKQKAEMAISDNNSNIGSLLQYSNKDELNEKVGLERNAKSNETWNLILFRDAKIGDVILANKGVSTLVGIGIVEGDYQYDPKRQYQHFRKVKWIADKVWNYTTNTFVGYKTLFRPDTFVRTIPGPQIITAYLKTYPEYTNTFAENGLLSNVEKPNLNNNKKTAMPPLNQILYGPPGTGKTFKLQNEYFEKFTTRISSLTKEQYFINKIGKYSWWQVIAAALIDLKTAKVSVIANHELVKLKSSVSESSTVTQTIWGQLQSHTIEGCDLVKVGKKMSPLIFTKKEDSMWEFVGDVKNEVPEVADLFTEYKNFTPTSDKEIKRYKFLTFHQSYSYEEFIEGIKPALGNDNQEQDLSYHIESGVFKEMCEIARQDLKNDYAIFIDEINRGNISNIFGELITLIEDDKRIGAKYPIYATLPYSKKAFGVPKNLYIIGTMNTADRSVEALDTALRRRFSFIEMMPDYSLLKPVGEIDLAKVLKIINKRLCYLINEDHQIGHSYFIGITKPEELETVFENKIIPLLKEYFYNDASKIQLVIGEGFVKKEAKSKPKFAVKGNDVMDKDVYSIVNFDANFNIMEAINAIGEE